MGKVCVSCGAAPEVTTKPDNESEDCPGCGGEDTVKSKEEGSDESNDSEE